MVAGQEARPDSAFVPLPQDTADSTEVTAQPGDPRESCGGAYHHVVNVICFLHGHFLVFFAFGMFTFCKHNVGDIGASRPECLSTDSRFSAATTAARQHWPSQQPRLQVALWSGSGHTDPSEGPGTCQGQGPWGGEGHRDGGGGGWCGLEDLVGAEAGGEMVRACTVGTLRSDQNQSLDVLTQLMDARVGRQGASSGVGSGVLCPRRRPKSQTCGVSTHPGPPHRHTNI